MATGINVDIYHPHTPTVQDLNGIHFLRTVLNMSRGHGFENYDQTIRDYKNFFDPFVRAGKKIILVINHQTWGEGKGLPLENPDYNWGHNGFTDLWVPKVSPLIQSFIDPGYMWQCFNEVDNASEAAYGIHPWQYDYMYRQFRKMVRSFRTTQPVITSGLVSGPGKAIQYAKDANLGASDVDIIAFHSYGTTAKTGPLKYKQYGFIEDEIAAWRRFTKKSLINTEFGLARLGEPEGDVANWVRNYTTVTELNGVDSVLFAWGDGQHNTFNVEGNNFFRNQLLDANRRKTNTTPKPDDDIYPGYVQQYFSGSSANIRSAPSISAPDVGDTYGQRLWVNELAMGVEADGYIWKQAKDAKGNDVWFAMIKNLQRKNV